MLHMVHGSAADDMVATARRTSLFASVDENRDDTISRGELVNALRKGILLDNRNDVDGIWARLRAREAMASKILDCAGLQKRPVSAPRSQGAPTYAQQEPRAPIPSEQCQIRQDTSSIPRQTVAAIGTILPNVPMYSPNQDELETQRSYAAPCPMEQFIPTQVQNQESFASRQDNDAALAKLSWQPEGMNALRQDIQLFPPNEMLMAYSQDGSKGAQTASLETLSIGTQNVGQSQLCGYEITPAGNGYQITPEGIARRSMSMDTEMIQTFDRRLSILSSDGTYNLPEPAGAPNACFPPEGNGQQNGYAATEMTRQYIKPHVVPPFSFPASQQGRADSNTLPATLAVLPDAALALARRDDGDLRVSDLPQGGHRSNDEAKLGYVNMQIMPSPSFPKSKDDDKYSLAPAPSDKAPSELTTDAGLHDQGMQDDARAKDMELKVLESLLEDPQFKGVIPPQNIREYVAAALEEASGALRGSRRGRQRSRERTKTPTQSSGVSHFPGLGLTFSTQLYAPRDVSPLPSPSNLSRNSPMRSPYSPSRFQRPSSEALPMNRPMENTSCGTQKLQVGSNAIVPMTTSAAYPNVTGTSITVASAPLTTSVAAPVGSAMVPVGPSRSQSPRGTRKMQVGSNAIVPMTTSAAYPNVTSTTTTIPSAPLTTSVAVPVGSAIVPVGPYSRSQSPCGTRTMPVGSKAIVPFTSLPAAPIGTTVSVNPIAPLATSISAPVASALRPGSMTAPVGTHTTAIAPVMTTPSHATSLAVSSTFVNPLESAKIVAPVSAVGETRPSSIIAPVAVTRPSSITAPVAVPSNAIVPVITPQGAIVATSNITPGIASSLVGTQNAIVPLTGTRTMPASVTAPVAIPLDLGIIGRDVPEEQNNRRSSIVYPVGSARSLSPLGAPMEIPPGATVPMVSTCPDAHYSAPTCVSAPVEQTVAQTPSVVPGMPAVAMESAAIQDAMSGRNDCPYPVSPSNTESRYPKVPASTLFSAVKACGDGNSKAMPRPRESLFSSIDTNRDTVISREELYAAVNAGIIKDSRPPVQLWYDVKPDEQVPTGNANEAFRTPPPVNNVSWNSTIDTLSPACMSLSCQDGNGTDASWREGYIRSGNVSMSTSSPMQIPVQMVDNRARGASTTKSCRSSVFFAFDDNDSDDDSLSRMDRANTMASTRSRAQSVPLSNKFTVDDVARRDTLAAQALGVSKSAKRGTVAGAFHKGARKHHPDKGGQKDDFQVLREAYARLLSERS